MIITLRLCTWDMEYPNVPVSKAQLRDGRNLQNTRTRVGSEPRSVVTPTCSLPAQLSQHVLKTRYALPTL